MAKMHMCIDLTGNKLCATKMFVGVHVAQRLCSLVNQLKIENKTKKKETI